MNIRLLTLALSVSLINAAWAVNKCTAKSGAVTFQDAPCSNESETKESVRVREQGTISSAGVYGVADLDLTGPAHQRLIRASAALETLADLSLDCKIKLQVYGSSEKTADACSRFATHYRAWWTPATRALKDLTNDDAFMSSNVREIERATGHLSKVNANAEFIVLRTKASR